MPPEVPDRLETLLDKDWLSDALGRRFPGIEVTAVHEGPVVSRLSTNARFSIECAGGVPDDLSPNLCAKGYFAESQRALAWLGEPEARFYATIAEATRVRTLRSVYADVHPTTRHGVIITEDVIEAGGSFLDALTPYSVDQTAESLEQFALLHAQTWGTAEQYASWLRQPLMPGRPNDSGTPSRSSAMRGVDDVRRNFEGAVGIDVADELRGEPQRVIDAMAALATQPRPEGRVVIHGDAHVGNLFLDGDGRPALVDWQVIQHNHWSIDVAYHVASALETEDRRGSERDLLAHYLDHLRVNGVGGPDAAQAWDDYRTALAYGVFMWGVTLLVDPKIIRRLLQRLTAAAAEHDTFGRLGV
jgi:Ecdysteroid kinase-like family